MSGFKLYYNFIFLNDFKKKNYEKILNSFINCLMIKMHSFFYPTKM